jgi:hypothetical protein
MATDCQVRSKTILAAFLLLLARFAVTAAAQDSPYSADSLMATFERGSKVSLKGTEISFRDVVTEYRDSKVIFKSTISGRVICDIVPTSRNLETKVVIGSPFQVTGKVRGRGLLGNVTLDNCNVAAVNKVATIPELPVFPEATLLPAAAPPEVINVSPASAPGNAAPAQSVQLPTVLRKPAKDFVPRPAPAKAATYIPETVSAQPVVKTETVGDDSFFTAALQHKEPPERVAPPKRNTPYLLYALLVLGGALAALILSRLVSSKGQPGSQIPASPENSTQTRQAALEELLLKSAKKR